MTATQEETNFYRVALIILDISGNVMRDMLASHIPPSNILSMVNNIPQKVRNKNLLAQQVYDINMAAMSGSYAGFDPTLCYFLLRSLSPSLKPTGKWGNSPISPQDITPGDDIERLRIYRNIMYGHVASASLSNGAYAQFLIDIGIIFQRFDLYTDPNGKHIYHSTTYSDQLKQVRTRQMDAIAYGEYMTQLKVLQAREIGLENRLEGIEEYLQNEGKETKAQLKVVQDGLKYETKEREIAITKMKQDMVMIKQGISNVEDKIDTSHAELNQSVSEMRSDTLDISINLEKEVETRKTDMESLRQEMVERDLVMRAEIAEIKEEKPVVEVKKEFSEEIQIVQWQVDDGICYSYEKNENEDVDEKLFVHSEISGWQRYQCMDREDYYFPPMKVVKLKGLKPNLTYDVKLTIRRRKENEITERYGHKTFQPVYRVTHHIKSSGSSGLQVMLHNDGRFAKIFASNKKEKVLKKKLDLEVFVGGGTRKTISRYDQWLDFCQDTLGQYFHEKTEYVSLEEWDSKVMNNWKRCFNITDVNDPVTKEYEEDLIRRLKENFKKGIFIFRDYDLQEHSSFFGYNLQDMGVDETLFDEKNGECIFVLIPKENTILLVRKTNTSNQSVGIMLCSIQRELQVLSHYAYMFNAIHYDVLEMGKWTVIPLVYLEKITKYQFTTITDSFASFPRCNGCKEYIIFKDHFLFKDFDKWWSGLKHYVGEVGVISKKTREMRIQLLAHITGFMATCAHPCLPGVYDSDTICLRKRSLVSLTKTQNEIMSSSDKHLIIRGGFGCGKSLLCKLLLFTLTDILPNGTIYYLSHDKHSLLAKEMVEVANKLKKKIISTNKEISIYNGYLHDYCKLSDLNEFDLVEFLNMLCQTKGNHLILDEFIAANLTKENALKVKEILKHPNLQESYIWIASQPIAKERHVKYSSAIMSYKQESFPDGYQFELTGMLTKVLGKNLRNTENIHKMIIEAKIVIEASTSKFNYEDKNIEPNKDLLGTGTSTKSTISPNEHKEKDNIYVEPGANDLEDKKKMTMSEKNMEKDSRTKNTFGTDIVVTDGDKKEIGKSQKESVTLKNQDELDLMFRTYGKTKREESKVVIETNFKIHGSNKLGHKVKGKQPCIISPFEDNNDIELNSDTVLRMHIVLMDLVKVKNGAAIICTDLMEAKLCVRALELAKKLRKLEYGYMFYLPTMIPEHKSMNIEVREIFGGKVIVADTEGVTGLEFDKVVVTVNPSEHFLSHTLISSLGRCQNELYLIKCPTTAYQDSHPITEEILKVWKEKELVKEVFLISKAECIEEDDGDDEDADESEKELYHLERRDSVYHFCIHNNESVHSETIIVDQIMMMKDIQNEQWLLPYDILRKPIQSKVDKMLEYIIPKKLYTVKMNPCHMICNTFKETENELPHDIDAENIASTFSWLNFEVKRHDELTSNDIMDKMIELSKVDYSDKECFVLFLLTNGDDERRIYGTDENYVDIDWIIETLVQSKTLKGIPKLIFIQACRGDHFSNCVEVEERLWNFQTRKVFKAQKSDIFTFYSTTQGNLSHMGSTSGSIFISTLCKVFEEYANDGTKHLGDVTIKVNELLSKHVIRLESGIKCCQVSEVNHTLTSNIYFTTNGEINEDVTSDNNSYWIGGLRKTYTKGRNPCHIICNTFKGTENELPSDVDAENIASTFHRLNFDVERHDELTSNDIMDKMIELSKVDYSGKECFVLFLLTSGDNKKRIYGTDENYIDIDWIIEELVYSKTLKGIPKLIFIQACRGNQFSKCVGVEEKSNFQTQKVLKAQKSDLYTFYATTQENIANIGSKTGSFFIIALCKVLQEYAADGTKHLGDVTTKVNELLSKHVIRIKSGVKLCQVSEVNHTLTSNIYFKPKGSYEEFIKLLNI